MTQQPDKIDRDQQHARARRTVAVLAIVAATIYVAFILKLVLFK